jgi:hypothetical protein
MGASRFTLCLNRADVRGFSHTHPVRIVEAVRSGSRLICEPFPGLSELVVPGRHAIVIDSTFRADSLRTNEREHSRSVREAEEILTTRAERQAQQLVKTVRGLVDGR